MSRCLLVSNRLPLAYNEKAQDFSPSSGGLVSAIKGLDAKKVGYDFEWMGIMTDDVDSEKINELKKIPFGDLRCHPIVIPKEMYEIYYNSFCNNVIWPLFHYERSMVQQCDKGWECYQKVNELVADAIIQEANEDDTIWIHDFHFFLVPGFIKLKRPDLKVGFFLHIPFPSSEIFRELPQRKEILLSLIQCDLVGFHDLSYLTHFKSSLSRVLGGNTNLFNDRKWGVYPISIDSQHFVALTHATETDVFIKRYAEQKKGKKWILGVDRLDYIKGLILKLKSFEEFLRRYPEQKEKVQMVQIVIPSRTDVPEYQDLKQKVEQLVSSINGEFGTPTYMPIHYLFHSVSEFELSALYQLSDGMHIGSRRDGMNLVSLEYVVSQKERHPGTLLLSEFTGAHSTLSYAVSINPWNIEETAEKIKVALEQPEEQRRREMMSMQDFLTRYTSSEWARYYLRDLNRKAPPIQHVLSLTKDGTFPWMKDIKGKKILFFFDILDILKLSTSRTPGSFIEDKGHAVTWHYRNSPPGFADFLANKLFIELEESLTSLPAQVSRGKKVIEVKSLHASKGFFVQQWLEKQEYQPDVIIALGDDTTDEDMFEYLQNKSEIAPFCIKVGDEKTQAKYFIKDQSTVKLFLENFIHSV